MFPLVGFLPLLIDVHLVYSLASPHCGSTAELAYLLSCWGCEVWWTSLYINSAIHPMIHLPLPLLPYPHIDNPICPGVCLLLLPHPHHHHHQDGGMQGCPLVQVMIVIAHYVEQTCG